MDAENLAKRQRLRMQERQHAGPTNDEMKTNVFLRRMAWAGFILLLGSIALASPTRTAWTTSNIVGSPEPPPPYVLQRAFPHLTFNKPIEAATIPGTNRLLLVEQEGKLFSFAADQRSDTADLVIDLHSFEPEMRESYAIAFHPEFQRNRFVYVMFILLDREKPNLENGSRIVRFTLPDSPTPHIDPRSGVTIFRWTSGGHNGCGIRFGPDGMLYISTGDGGGAEPPDPLVTGQNLDDHLSCILRIDVDRASGDNAYQVPPDNPFVKVPGARGEIWAYGLRNPWRIAFNKSNGDLYAGEVGWERWEMIHRIVRGGNSGWSITEAMRQDVRPDRVTAPHPIRPPLVAHPHEEAASITGGEFYHGKRLHELVGQYVYADWQMGTFWAIKAEGDRVISHREIARSNLMPSGFATLPDGEILACDHSAGGLWKLEKNVLPDTSKSFPKKLSQTGLFSTVQPARPALGVHPYILKANRFRDYASAERWIAVPSTDPITIADTDLGVQAAGRWVFPVNTVFAKTYSLEIERGNPASQRLIETQILHFTGPQAAAYTYRWNDKQTDADLVPAQGAETTIQVKDASAPGGIRQQLWRFNSRTECIRCHTVWNNFTPGFNALHLDHPTPDSKGNQLDHFKTLGLAVPRPQLVDPADSSQPLATRARSYLHENCAGCHRKNGGGAVPSYLDIELSLKESRVIDQSPIQGGLGLPDPKVIAPGDPARSVLLYRMASTGSGHMPHLGSNLVHDDGLRLVHEWIASLRQNPAHISETVLKQRDHERALLEQATQGHAAPIEDLLASASGALSLALALNDGTLPPEVRKIAIQKGNTLADPLKRDLFERFVPQSERRKTLGTHFEAEAILALEGNRSKGFQLFTALCSACHHVNGTGIAFGPDLREVAKRYPPAELLEHIRKPSKQIDQKWQLTTVQTDDATPLIGFIEHRTDQFLTLRQAGGITQKVDVTKIKSITSDSRVSAMPEGLLQSSTAQEVADLLAWLRSLGAP